MTRVGVIGIGWSRLGRATRELSYKEMIYEAVRRAQEDAGLSNQEIPSVVTTGEDFSEGRAIADEFTVDPTGGVLKSNDRICGDSLYGLFTAYMQIRAGLFDTVLVVGYSKPSDVVNPSALARFALDPIFERGFHVHPYYIPALEMNRYMHEYGVSKGDIARVVCRNRAQALRNPRALFGAQVDVDTVLAAESICSPLGALDIASEADGAIAMVVASEKKVREMGKDAVWIEGIGWASDSCSAFWYQKDLANAGYLELAARQAYRMAGIKNPPEELDVAEIDDRFSYKFLQHIEALGLCARGQAASVFREECAPKCLRVALNPSGGLLGLGNLDFAAGLALAAEVVEQLRRSAGSRQVPEACRGLVGVWCGVPSRSGGVAIFGKER